MQNNHSNNNGRNGGHSGNGSNANANSKANHARLRFCPDLCCIVLFQPPKGPTIDAMIFGAQVVVGGELRDEVTLTSQTAFQNLLMDANELECSVLSIELEIRRFEKEKAAEAAKKLELAA